MERLQALKDKVKTTGSIWMYGPSVHSFLKYDLIPVLEEVYQEIESLKDSRKEGR